MTDLPKILLVDDNPVNLKVTEKLLQKEQVQVNCARDGETAVKAVCEAFYALVLMDVQLPGIDGLEATRQIRRWEKTAASASGGCQAHHLPIIALTGEDLPENQQACLNAGMDQVLQKPVNAEKIKNLLEGSLVNTEKGERTSSHILTAIEQAEEGSATVPDEMPVRDLMAFRLDQGTYCFDLTYLKKIVWVRQITPVPGVPGHILGVINVRGEIISVVDLKALLGISGQPPSKPAIMITSRQGIDVGFLVDSVEDIVEIPPKSIDPPMITFEKEYVDLIEGESQMDDTLLVILDYESIMASDKMAIHKTLSP